MLSLSLLSLGQENNVWHFVEAPLIGSRENPLNSLYTLDFNQSPPSLAIVNDSVTPYSLNSVNTTVCNKKGELEVYTLYDTLYNLRGKKITLKSERVYSDDGKQSELVGYSSNKDTLFVIIVDPESLVSSYPVDSAVKDHSLWLKSFSTFTGEPLSKERFLNGRFDFDESKSEQYLQGGVQKLYSKYYPQLDIYWIAIPHHDSITLCKLNRSFEVLKTVPLSNNIVLEDNGKVLFSNDGRKIAVNGHWDKENITSWKNAYRYGTGNYIVIYDFDPKSGSISNKKELVYPKVDGFADNNTAGQPILPDYRYYFKGLAFSPSDSFLYTVEVDTKPDPDKYYYRQLATWDSSVKYRVPLHYTPVFDSDLKLGPDGKMYVVSQAQVRRSYLDVIHKPNLRGEEMELARDDILINITNHNRFGSFFRWPNTLGVYKRVSFTAKPTCNGLEYSFSNTSDTSHFSHFRFYFGNGDSAEITSNELDQNIYYTYSQPGKYLVHLRAFNSVGGWIYTRDSITVVAPPSAKISVKDTVGCQWLAYTYTDRSMVNPHNTKYYTRLWQFDWVNGTQQERDTVFFGESSSTKHKVFNQDGNYTTTLYVNNGYCTDTALLEQQVTILPAPQPGIRLSDTTGCSPLTLNFSGLHTDVVDSVVWQLGAKKWLSSGLSNTINDTLIEVDSYQLLQTNYGPTGCVTADTLAIEVLEGFPPGYKPLLHTATFLEKNSDSVGVFWQAAPNAKAYQLLLNGNAVTSTQDTFYTLASPNLPATFIVEAENICNEKAVSNLGKLIHLSVSRTEDNKAAVIQFTPYEEWPYGIAAYHIERLANGSFNTIGSLSNAIPFTDADFAKRTDANQCYRIKATQQNGRWYSYSNSVCVPLAPIVWVPTAFTPNNDGLNDAFNLVAQGAETIEYSIYNRWGQLIYKGKLWDGANAPTGVYQYNAVVEFEDGQRTFLNGTVSLIR